MYSVVRCYNRYAMLRYHETMRQYEMNPIAVMQVVSGCVDHVAVDTIALTSS